TISDSAPGILAALRVAFGENGVPWLDDVAARSLLGPPFHESLTPLVGADRFDSVVASYRHHYVDLLGMLETSLYDGIVGVLETLRDAGLTLAVATSKPESYASKIVEHLGLPQHFSVVGGDTLDGRRGSKALVIGDVLHRLGDPDPATVLMIGDRSHDVHGAAAHGIPCVGALWGYGTVAELQLAGAAAVCMRPEELLATIL
ncbi:MAG: HAD hydrolase-like protein, partial [Ilumatobacteraceae bacterium]